MQITFDLFNDSLMIGDLENMDREPWEMTLSEFMSMKEWDAFPDPNTRPENRGNYVLRKPNGEMWQGGWIGKFRSAEAAKKEFHYRQIYYKLLWCGDISERILQDYPKLLQVKKTIDHYVSCVHINRGDYVRVKIEGEDKFFHKEDFPMYCRVSARGFVRNNGLAYPSGLKVESINGIEIGAIALYQCLIQSGVSPDQRPHMLYGAYHHLYSSYGEYKVRFKRPTEIDADGNAVAYEHFEGVAKKTFAFDYPLVEFIDQDMQTKNEFLHPTELIALYAED